MGSPLSDFPDSCYTLLKTIMDSKQCKFLALLMAVNCVRNTVLESYHAGGKITDPEMKAFNQEVVNKLYTFLTLYFLQNEESSKAFLNLVARNYPEDWDEPKLDPDFGPLPAGFPERG